MASAIRTDTGGVTSPLGNGLIIAIAILLAVGLAIMVRVFSDQEEEAPPVTFARDETADSLQVLHAREGLRRSDFQVRLSVDGDLEIGGPVQPGGDLLSAGAFAYLGGDPDGPADGDLVTGNSLHFCAEPGAERVHVEIRHVGSNTIILNEDFLSLADCPT